MKIRISDLPPSGLPISAELALDALNSRLNQGQQTEIMFTSAPRVEAVATPNADGAEVVGKVTTNYKQACGRCADLVDRELEVDLNFILKPKPPVVTTEDAEAFEDDLGMLFFSGEHIDLEDAIQESLIVSLSLYWSPPVDKQNKCTLCGKKAALEVALAPTSATFGALLKKAGVN